MTEPSAAPAAQQAAATGWGVDRVQSRVLRVLVLGQVLGGLGMGASLSTGALLVSAVSGSDALSGMSATMLTLGTALASVPLARLAIRRGRRIALGWSALIAVLGAALIIVGAQLGLIGLVFAALMLIGVGSAGGQQARFAAADLSVPRRRGRDLSIVVWSITIGAVAGPNILEPGDALGQLIGLVPLSGPYLITIAAQLLATAVYLIALRPDPLLLARSLALAGEAAAAASADAARGVAGVLPVGGTQAAAEHYRPNRTVVVAMLTMALSHAVMVGVMAMTPIHLVHHGVHLSIVGFSISLHIAGMYALSPVFGWLADRWGRMPVILLGQALLLASLAVMVVGEHDAVLVTVGLVLLGLGWSAATVAASVLLTDAVPTLHRAGVQGVGDALMSFAGAGAGALAGLVLVLIGYAGLAVVSSVLVAAVVVAVALLWLPGRTRLESI